MGKDGMRLSILLYVLYAHLRDWGAPPSARPWSGTCRAWPFVGGCHAGRVGASAEAAGAARHRQGASRACRCLLLSISTGARASGLQGAGEHVPA